MRIWRWQKVIGFDACKIMILTGHDIQMTWQPSISINMCVSILHIVLSNNVGFSLRVGNRTGFFWQFKLFYFIFFQSDVALPKAVSAVCKCNDSLCLLTWYPTVSGSNQEQNELSFNQSTQNSLSWRFCPGSLLRDPPIIPCCGAPCPPGLSSPPQ